MSDYPEFVNFLNHHFTDLCFRREYRFNQPQTNHRFDVALPCCKLAIEIEGGATAGKGHRGIGNFLSDMRKYNLAASQGWRLLRFTPSDVNNLTKATFLPIIETYFRNFPCQHQELNFRLRAVFV